MTGAAGGKLVSWQGSQISNRLLHCPEFSRVLIQHVGVSLPAFCSWIFCEVYLAQCPKKDNDNAIQRTPWQSNPRDLWPLRHFIRVMRWWGNMTWPSLWQFWQLLTFLDNFQRFLTILKIRTIAVAILTIEKTILETCDIWDTDYNSDNWEPEFMTIFVT